MVEASTVLPVLMLKILVSNVWVGLFVLAASRLAVWKAAGISNIDISDNGEFRSQATSAGPPS